MATVAGLALNPENLSISVEAVKARHGEPPWSEQIVRNDRYVVTVICQEPGHQNDWHYHVVDECWFIYEGQLSWTMEGHAEPVHVSAGDWILAPANTCHYIQVHGDAPAIRIAIAYEGEPHRHEREGGMPPAPPGARTA